MREVPIFNFACDICGAEFTNKNKETAQELARFCERKGKLAKHRFMVGQVVKAVKPDMTGPGSYEDGDITAKIKDLAWGLHSHDPYYVAQQLTGAVIQGSGIIDIKDKDVRGVD